MRFLGFVVGLCGAFFCNLAQADNVMKVASVFGVGKDGQAQYTVPINLPSLPGELGSALALHYDSQSGVGPAGKGWHIAGLSMIARCDLNVSQDGVSEPVLRGKGPARYCLDGQRLTLDQSTANEGFQVYRAEFEKFSRIRANQGGGDDIFIVETKSGVKLTYRAQLTTLANPTTTVKWWWPLAEVQNRFGSRVIITYTWDSTNVLRPNSVKQEQDDGTYRVLAEFKYGPITDAARPFAYREQLLQQQSYLSSIISYGVSKQKLKEYKFTYALDPATHLPTLKTLEECQGFCHPAVVFTYAGEEPHFTPAIESPVLDWGNKYGREWVDANGDGKVDFCRVIGPAASARLACTLSTGNGFGSTVMSDVLDAGADGSQKWVDVNADGFADYCRTTGIPEAYRLACTFGGASGFGATVSSSIDVGSEMQNAKWHDTRRDGRLRYCRYDSAAQFRCAALSGNAFVDEAGVGGSGAGVFDMVDLISKAPPYRCFRQPTKFVCVTLDGSAERSSQINGYQGWWADINGDGHSDYCQATTGAVNATIQCGRSLATTQSLSPTEYAGQIPGTNVVAGLVANAKWVDVNGDQGADYCRVIGTAGNYRLACSSFKNNFFRDPVQSDVLDIGQNDGQDWVDVTGNRAKAFCRLIGSANLIDSRLACTPLSPPGGQLVQIDNGIGASIKIEYKPLTDSSVYVKEANATYPMKDMQEPVYVVSKVEQGNGSGGYVGTGYRYGGAVKDVSGRGAMGVRWREEKKLSSGMLTRTEYRQDLPFTGLPIRTTVSLAGKGNDGILSDVSYEYGCNDFINTTGCAVVRGGRYFPYLAKTVTRSWDLDGTEMPTITSTQEFDSWGSVTRSKQSASDGIAVETVNTYKNISTTSLWLPGLLEKSETTKSAPSN